MPKKPPRPRSRLEAARARMYRDLVFEAAEHVFARKGFDEATMQDLAAEAGISLKTLYSVFPGKNELYAEIGRVRGIEFAEKTAAASTTPGTALERLALGVRAYVDFLVAHPDFLRIHLREGRAWAIEPEGPARESWALGVGGMAEIVREGMREGVFYEGDVEIMALSGIALMQVALARRAEGIAPDDAPVLVDEVLLQLRRLYCKPEHLTDSGRSAA